MEKNINDYIKELFEYQRRSKFNDDSGSGKLMVTLTHSKGTFPVINGRVNVRNSDGAEITTVFTDESGKTEEIILPAPSVSASESPGASFDTVAGFYNIFVSADGYVDAEIRNIPIFDGITSMQTYDMIFQGAAPDDLPQVIILPMQNAL